MKQIHHYERTFWGVRGVGSRSTNPQQNCYGKSFVECAYCKDGHNRSSRYKHHTVILGSQQIFFIYLFARTVLEKQSRHFQFLTPFLFFLPNANTVLAFLVIDWHGHFDGRDISWFRRNFHKYGGIGEQMGPVKWTITIFFFVGAKLGVCCRVVVVVELEWV